MTDSDLFKVCFFTVGLLRKETSVTNCVKTKFLLCYVQTLADPGELTNCYIPIPPVKL